jgi:putative transposase
LASRGRRSIGVDGPPGRRRRHHARLRRARSCPPSGKRCSTSCTASDSSISRPRKSTPRYSRSTPISARRARCIASSDAAQELRERRDQARHPAYAKPELVATAPNQIWSWDITKLKGPIPYLYYSLYVIRDLFSRYVVGWMVATRESAPLAERLIEHTCAKQGIQPQQLTIHADRGAPMRSQLVALLFSDLGIDASYSRPRVSNDNPFSEAQFRTLKYRPEFPNRFGSREHARAICHDLFAWYNDAHHHSGLRYLIPADVHYGRATTILERRHHTRLAAYADHPERFVNGPPRAETLPTAVWINPPTKTACEDAPRTTIVVPDDPQHGVILGPQGVLDDRPLVLVNIVESLQ